MTVCRLSLAKALLETYSYLPKHWVLHSYRSLIARDIG
uniref:Uncharacterized protein n=1 Tax=Arundo donax TaxID=35708 RepID=A0A0A9FQC1_ARUDO